jgi:ParB/RepB/Spo0J family partition protein
VSLAHVEPELARVPVGLIDEPRLMSRNQIDEEHVEQLRQSMLQQGFTSSIVLARADARYEVVAGHHRLLAARLANLAAVPALVYPTYVDGIEAIQHSENAQQKPTTPCDEAVWYAQLLELHPDKGTDGVAARVGESRGYVEGRLALLYGDEQVFAALGAKDISIGVAQQLNRCTDETHRRYLLDLAVRSGATVSLVTQWVHEWKTIHAPATPVSVDAAPVADVAAPVFDEYFTCRICGERDNRHAMRPLNTHEYCLRPLIDTETGLFKSRRDYLEFPVTREAAVAVIHRIVARFPELADGTT